MHLYLHYFVLIIAIAGFVACVLLAKLGYGTASSIIGGGTIVALVGSFVYVSQGKNYEQSQDSSENNK